MGSLNKFEVAICGAGLAGFSLALSLNAKGIPCIVYDAAARPQTVIKGSINLAPNGQAVLDDIDILERVLPTTCAYRDVIIRNIQGTPISKMLIGRKETFKYDSIRLMRADLIDSFAKACHERGIPVVCNKKFQSVVSESEEGVTFRFEDGTNGTASMLIGADGIFSHIRASMYSDVNVDYIGHIAIMTTVDSEIASLETEQHQGMTLGNEIGTMMLGRNNADLSNWIVVLQKVHPDLGKAGWKQFGEDKQALKEFMRKDYDKWPTYCQRALDTMDEEALFLWPMYTAPALPSWSSPKNRVLLIGDAVSQPVWRKEQTNTYRLTRCHRPAVKVQVKPLKMVPLLRWYSNRFKMAPKNSVLHSNFGRRYEKKGFRKSWISHRK